jgi:acetoacetyl-CoA synthetase
MVVWEPSPEDVARAEVTAFAQWIEETRSVRVTESYDQLWRWSTDDVEGFWQAVWERYDVQASGRPRAVLSGRAMPGARWFDGVALSYAEQVFRDRDDAAVALLFAGEGRDDGALGAWTWGELRAQTARIAAGLRRLGVRPGDRVAAYLPNVPETMAAFLACASLGATWSAAAPEFGAQAVVDRFAQIEPKVLLAVDAYTYDGKRFDRAAVVDRLASELPSVEHVAVLGTRSWDELTAHEDVLTFARLPFDHPLWVLYSSGTTGLPKAIVNGHGGMLLEHLKLGRLHVGARAGDRIFWFTTTGWMMWNFLAGMLLTDAAVVLYDGAPAADALWRLAAESETTIFGTSAAFLAACRKDDNKPPALPHLRAVGSTGSPLAPEDYDWVAETLARPWLFSMSGGTDMCTAFVGGVPTLPVRRGELQAPALGARVQAWDPDGRPLGPGAVGELVITEPMPCMPVGFWGDDAAQTRYREAYFEHYDTDPPVWRHGDWIELTPSGGAIIHGRSDSTINRGGVRMGTSEIYRAVLAEEDVVDALVVDVDGWMPLFVVLRDGEAALTEDLVARIRARIRNDCSPRHVPSEIRAIAEVPRTLSGKALEVPVKRILMGRPVDEAVAHGALANPAALEPFTALASARAQLASARV